MSHTALVQWYIKKSGNKRMFGFNKQQYKKYEELIEAAVDECIEKAPIHNNIYPLERIPADHQKDFLQLASHLKGEKYIKNRTELYRKIFDDVFTKNGIPFKPEGSKRTYFLMAEAFSDGKYQLIDRLKKGDASLPKNLTRAFKRVNNDRTITIDFQKIMTYFPEFRQAVKEKYPYPLQIVYAETKTICEVMTRLARDCGYNIIDLISSHSSPKGDVEINALKNISHTTTPKEQYRLVSVCHTGDIETLVRQVPDYRKFASKDYQYWITKLGLHKLAQLESFRELMKNSDEAMVVWDHGKENASNRFEITASKQSNKIKVHNHTQWDQFRDYASLEVGNISHKQSNSTPGESDSTTKPHSSKENKGKSWTSKEEERAEIQNPITLR